MDTSETLTTETTHSSITNAPSNPAPCPTCTMALRLNPIQYPVYHALHDLIDKGEPKVILIDAPSGTGKTRILSTLAQKYSDIVQFAVYIRANASRLTLNQVHIETHSSYLKKNFNRNFDEVLRMFTLDNLSNTDVLFELLTYAQEYSSLFTKVIIMDDCAIMNPLMMLLLYIVCLKNKITLIFSGNRMQLGPIDKTKLNDRSNFDVLELFCDCPNPVLTRNMRFKDQNLLENVTRFGDAIANYKTKEQVPFHFNLRYFLYTLFREKFDPRIPESSNNLFMAQFHRVITERLYRMMAADPNKYRVAYFNAMPLNFDEKNKFMTGLILDKGTKYIYVSETGVDSFVVLEDMLFNGQTLLSELLVRFEDGTRKRIGPCDLNNYQLLYAYRKWLKETMELPSYIEPKICNFPLKPYTMTYHAASGRTIKNDVELSTDRIDTITDYTDATTVYVGLCSLRFESNIRKFHAEQYFPSFVVTDIMAAEDKEEYYYCYPTTGGSPSILAHIGNKIGDYSPDEYLKSFLVDFSWNTVDNINDFEKRNGFLRIKRSVYENNKMEVDKITDSPLMKITKFVKNNTDVVMDILENIENLGREKAKMALAEAYEKWEESREREADRK